MVHQIDSTGNHSYTQESSAGAGSPPLNPDVPSANKAPRPWWEKPVAVIGLLAVGAVAGGAVIHNRDTKAAAHKEVKYEQTVLGLQGIHNVLVTSVGQAKLQENGLPAACVNAFQLKVEMTPPKLAYAAADPLTLDYTVTGGPNNAVLRTWEIYNAATDTQFTESVVQDYPALCGPAAALKNGTTSHH